MSSVKYKKLEIFNSVISNIDKKIILSNERETKIVAMVFEMTFDMIVNHINKDIKENYTKKKKPRKIKNSQKRLDKIIS